MSSNTELCRALGEALDAVLSLHLVPGRIGHTNEISSVDIDADGEPIFRITAEFTGTPITWGGISARSSLIEWLGELYEPMIGFGAATAFIERGKLDRCTKEVYIMHISGVKVIVEMLVGKDALVQLFPKAVLTTIVRSPYAEPEEASWVLRTVRKIGNWLDN